ncbi:MAG: hypothetical protein ACRETL_01190, partial [Gammaproteobacteria bacterium]
KMHRQMADMMKEMARNPSMLKKMAGAMGLGGFGVGMGAAPSEAEIARMKEELSKLDPKALDSLPPEVKALVAKGGGGPMAAGPKPVSGGLPGLSSGAPPGLSGGAPPGQRGAKLPGLGGAGLPSFPGIPGKKT